METPQTNLPPGFRFHPTDAELILHYLRKKIASIPLPVSIIAEVDIYKLDPWDLPGSYIYFYLYLRSESRRYLSFKFNNVCDVKD
jgi:hypothetical protein